jgi:uncharacterized membrane protein
MTGPRATPFSKGRLEALSDGVFAIAMTLLVLESLFSPRKAREVRPPLGPG